MINFELASLDILFADMWVQVDKQVTALVSGQSVDNQLLKAKKLVKC